MQPKIDILNGAKDTIYLNILDEAIHHLSIYKPGIEVRIRDAYEMLEKLKPNATNQDNTINFMKLITRTHSLYKDTPIFQRHTQKIFLIDEPGRICDVNTPLANGFGLRLIDNLQQKDLGRQSIIMSTDRMDTSHIFYAICCHELGHMYGALNRLLDTEETIGGTHCTIDTCVMQANAYNDFTFSRKLLKSPMYCPQCQKGLINF